MHYDHNDIKKITLLYDLCSDVYDSDSDMYNLKICSKFPFLFNWVFILLVSYKAREQYNLWSTNLQEYTDNHSYFAKDLKEHQSKIIVQFLGKDVCFDYSNPLMEGEGKNVALA